MAFRNVLASEMDFVTGGTGESQGETYVTYEVRNPDSGEVKIGWVELDGVGSYDQNTGYFLDSTGMVFRDFQSCVDHYANEYRDDRMDELSILGPFGEILKDILEEYAKNHQDQDYTKAADTCSK